MWLNFSWHSIKYNFMACLSSLAIGAFALNSWSNTLLHKFFFFFKKNARKQQQKYKKDIVSAIIFYFMYIEIIFTIKVYKQTS